MPVAKSGSVTDTGALPGSTVVADELLDVLSAVPDRRKSKGIRHRLGSILAIAVAAVAAGAKGFTAVHEWALDATVEELARLGVGPVVPSETAIRRNLQSLDGNDLDRRLAAWMWLRTRIVGGRRVVAFDGKTMRGAKDAAGNPRHLLSGVNHGDGAVVGQLDVAGKTNEIPVLRELLATMDLTGVVATADALHTQDDTARAIVDGGGDYILTVKGNRKNLRKQCKDVPWGQVPVASTTTGKKRHGRVEKRTLKATAIEAGVLFPHAAQVLKIIRTVTGHKKNGKKTTTTEVVYAVTSLTAADATPIQIAEWLRGHWTIENKLHHVRDTAFAEDHSQIRTGEGPQVMASLRNLVISILRLAGRSNIAKALRHNAADHNRPIDLVLTS